MRQYVIYADNRESIHPTGAPRTYVTDPQLTRYGRLVLAVWHLFRAA